MLADLRRITKAVSKFRLLLVIALFTAAASAAPVRLRCEYLVNPLGIDQALPRLSWQSESSTRNWKQSAYEILVATSPEKLAANQADVWDSGKKASADSVGIPYAGPTLESRHRYYWKVRTWDSSGTLSESSEPAWWEMGLLHSSDWKSQVDSLEQSRGRR